MKKAAVFCSHGLGDGLIFLSLAYNLSKNGFTVDTYHPSLLELQNWVKYTKLKKEPLEENILETLKNYDLIIINSDYREINKKIKDCILKNYADIFFELHPTTCKSKSNPIGSMRFDFHKNIMLNLKDFCEKKLDIKYFEANDLLTPFSKLTHRKNKNRIIIHPTSKDIEKNWPNRKYEMLCVKLKKRGFDCKIILTKDEKKNYVTNFETPEFNNLSELACYIYESGYKIGNDSEISHLASLLNIPTLTIFSTKRKMRFWRPFKNNSVVVSFPLINIKGLRLREKYWKYTISVRRVLKKFKKILRKEKI